MNLAQWSLRHKYSVIAATIAIVLFGIFARQTLRVNLFPDTAPPLVNVVTAYPGVAAKDVARDLNKPMEEEFATLEGVKRIKSTAQDGLSIVKVEFHYGRDVTTAAVDVQNAINRIRRNLPQGMQEPQVMRFSTSNRPVITYALKSQTLNPAELRALADNELKNALQTVDGVAAVDVFGGYARQIRVQVDKARLDALGLSLDRVAAAVRGENVAAPGGRIVQEDREYLIRLVQEYASVDAIADTIIDNRGGRLIRLRDVAEVVDGTADPRSEFRFKGESAVALQVLKRDDANTVQVVDRVRERVAELEKAYPQVKLEVADDGSEFTRLVIDNMSHAIMEAVYLTALIILFSLVALKESFIVSLSMPISFLGSLALMKAFNMELNTITLSGLILSIGIIVDDAIVVLENIMRYRHELKKDPVTAAIEGTKEISLSVLAGKSTKMIVLVPLLFIGGFVGKVFGPMAQTLIIADAVSFFVALTIIPLLSVAMGREWAWSEPVLRRVTAPYTVLMEGLRNFYTGMLRNALKMRLLSLAIAAATLVAGMGFLRMIGMEVLPKQDSASFTISLQTEPGSSLARTSEVVRQVEQLLAREPNVVSWYAQIGFEPGAHSFSDVGAMGVTQALMSVKLTTRTERSETIWQVEDRLRSKIARIPGIETFVVKEAGATAMATTAAPIDIRISGRDPEVLYQLAQDIKDRISRVPGAVNLYTSWSLTTPEVTLRVREERAAELGFSPSTVIREVFASLEGIPASALKSSQRKDTSISVRLRPEDRASLERLSEVTITSPMGLRVPLRELVDVEVVKGANLVTREGLVETIDVLGHTYGRAFSHVMGDIQRVLKEVRVPAGYEIAITGEQQDLKESTGDLKFALLMAVLAVYLLLVSQFRSFIHPVTIMVAIPLVIIGVALALLWTGKSVSMSVLLGLILLVGTVVNNSILLIDFIIRAREKGMGREDAIVSSVRVRYRPIMMTALSQVFGMLPLAMERAVGSERFSPLATTVIGGILTATLLTMVVVPVVYTIFDDMGLAVRSLFAPRLKGAAQRG